MVRISYSILVIILFLFVKTALANNPLPAEEAFQVKSTFNNKQQTLILKWSVKPGYFIYQNSLQVSFKNNPRINLLSPDLLPTEFIPHQTELGTILVYDKNFSVVIPIKNKSDVDEVLISYQGCNSSGFCYPPVKQKISLTQKSFFNSSWRTSIDEMVYTLKLTEDGEFFSNLFSNLKWPFIILAFIIMGLLLSLTPCVLPMFPILLKIISGPKTSSRKHAFYISLCYVLGSAASFALAGILAAFLGSSIQAFLQRPFIIVSFSLIFILLALSEFGLYEIQMPSRWQTLMHNFNVRHTTGGYLNIVFIGALSALVLSPCVTAPLIGVLTYIGHTGNMWLGGISLFALGIGMGLPLILLAWIGPSIMRTNGPWLKPVKSLLGIMLLGVAVLLLQRIFTAELSQWLWSIFAGTVFVLFLHHLSIFKFTSSTQLRTFIFIILIIVFSVLTNLFMYQSKNDHLTLQQDYMVHVEKLAKLKSLLAQARQAHKPVMIDTYANWCISCKIMQKNVFQQEDTKKLLSNYLTIKLDLSHNNEESKALMKMLGIIAPPTLIFYDKQGKEIKNGRVIGEINKRKFFQHLNKLFPSSPQQQIEQVHSNPKTQLVDSEDSE